MSSWGHRVDDVIVGLGDDDVISGSDGNDRLGGDAGSDIVMGRPATTRSIPAPISMP